MTEDDYRARWAAYHKRWGRAMALALLATVVVLAVELETFLDLLAAYRGGTMIILMFAVIVLVLTLLAHAKTTRRLMSSLKKKHGLACPQCGQIFFAAEQRDLFETGRCACCGSSVFVKAPRSER